MRSIYIELEDQVSLGRTLNLYEEDSQIKAILFFMADENHLSEEILKPFLTPISKPIIGGVFPELIFEGERKKTGILLLPLLFDLKTQVFDLSEDPEMYLSQLEEVQENSMNPMSSLFVFTDALSNRKEVFLESLFNFFGMNTTYIGGGAGSLTFESFPCIISNDGLFENSAVIGWGNKKMRLGVAHGWHTISSMLKVTQTDENVVESINWKPAFEIYKEVVEEHSGQKLTLDNFFEIAKSYPLGIEKLDAEMIVRDPLKLMDNGLQFVDKIREGEYVKILHGDIDSLLLGASCAKESALSKLEKCMNHDVLFCIDCISRVLFMDDEYEKELNLLAKNKDVSGILSIGEIANSGESFLEIFNKTIAISVW